MEQPTPIYDQLVREQEQQCTPDPQPDQGDPQPDASPSWPSGQPS